MTSSTLRLLGVSALALVAVSAWKLTSSEPEAQDAAAKPAMETKVERREALPDRPRYERTTPSTTDPEANNIVPAHENEMDLSQALAVFNDAVNENPDAVPAEDREVMELLLSNLQQEIDATE